MIRLLVGILVFVINTMYKNRPYPWFYVLEFDEFQMSQPRAERRPNVDTLYDVFVAIRDDEMEHVKTMVACQQPDAQQLLQSPHSPSLRARFSSLLLP